MELWKISFFAVFLVDFGLLILNLIGLIFNNYMFQYLNLVSLLRTPSSVTNHKSLTSVFLCFWFCFGFCRHILEYRFLDFTLNVQDVQLR